MSSGSGQKFERELVNHNDLLTITCAEACRRIEQSILSATGLLERLADAGWINRHGWHFRQALAAEAVSQVKASWCQRRAATLPSVRAPRGVAKMPPEILDQFDDVFSEFRKLGAVTVGWRGEVGGPLRYFFDAEGREIGYHVDEVGSAVMAPNYRHWAPEFIASLDYYALDPWEPPITPAMVIEALAGCVD